MPGYKQGTATWQCCFRYCIFGVACNVLRQQSVFFILSFYSFFEITAAAGESFLWMDVRKVIQFTKEQLQVFVRKWGCFNTSPKGALWIIYLEYLNSPTGHLTGCQNRNDVTSFISATGGGRNSTGRRIFSISLMTLLVVFGLVLRFYEAFSLYKN